MLGRLVLILLQIAAGWFIAPMIMTKLPALGGLAIFLDAVVTAIIVWLVGFLGAVVLKDVAQPSPATLTSAVVGGLIGAVLTQVPQVTTFVSGVLKGGIPQRAYLLAGAVIGYAIKR